MKIPPLPEPPGLPSKIAMQPLAIQKYRPPSAAAQANPAGLSIKRDFQPLMDTYRESPIHLRPKGFGGTSSRFLRYCQKGMRDGNRHGRWPGSPEEWGIPSELGVTHPCGLPGWTCPAPPRMPLQSARPSRTICRGHYPGIISAHKWLKFSPAPSNIQH